MGSEVEETSLILHIQIENEANTSAAKRDHTGSFIVSFGNIGLKVIFSIEVIMIGLCD